MFDNAGYFCCEKGEVGYNIRNTDGCSISGHALPEDAIPLAVIDQIQSRTSTSISAAPTSPSPTSSPPASASTSPTAPPSATPNTSSNTAGGAIAGAVVGGVVGIIVVAGVFGFFLRKKKGPGSTQYLHDDRGGGEGAGEYHPTPAPSPAEMGGTPKAELATVTDRSEGRSEMP
ncbi:hypothetical protein F4802DRAFT_140861 [Xylaria palmicola]|nr:hypothetical protein F4802DRAFT_140861 [Xylaria palmicola]